MRVLNEIRLCLALALAITATMQACAQPARTAPAPSRSLASLSPKRQLADFALLKREIPARVARVRELEWIREWARAKGVRVWLFGGTAAAYAHYVNWDLLREGGDARYDATRFDYDYTNIFRADQDLDLVVDGPPDHVGELRSELESRFGYLQGSKSTWDVRLLKQDMGEKLALLNNPDFLNQHSDSNSTGLIEITSAPENEPPIRDLFDWENTKAPRFLQDVHARTLHYYWNPLHETTSRFKSGVNPPILSVIRYFTKAFQYELDIPKESLAHLKKVIAEFKPATDIRSDYVRRWIEKNASKMVKFAVNLEFAFNVMDEMGLRKILVPLSNRDTPDAMGLWLGKEPLRSKPIGEGSGKTARELGIDIVAHETNSFLAYESITKAPSGEPNVFKSRAGYPLENAGHGDGFYARVGKFGAAGTGITIRLKMNPDAREGSDFTLYDRKNDAMKGTKGAIDDWVYVIVQNKNACRVIPESLQYTAAQYLAAIAGGLASDPNDRGVWEKFRRRAQVQAHTMSDEEFEAVRGLLENETKSQAPRAVLFKSAIQLLAQDRLVPFFDSMFQTLDSSQGLAEFRMFLFLRIPEWISDNDRLNPLEAKLMSWWNSEINKPGHLGAACRAAVVAGPGKLKAPVGYQSARVAIMFPEDPRVLLWFFQNHKLVKDALYDHILSSPYWVNHPDSDAIMELAFEMYKQRLVSSLTLMKILQHWSSHPRALEYLERLMRDLRSPEAFDAYLLSYPGWGDHPALLRICGGPPTAGCLLEYLYAGKSLASGAPLSQPVQGRPVAQKPIPRFPGETLDNPESSLFEIFKELSHAEEFDRMALTQLQRRMIEKAASASVAEQNAIAELVRPYLRDWKAAVRGLIDDGAKFPNFIVVAQTWFRMPFARNFPELTREWDDNVLFTNKLLRSNHRAGDDPIYFTRKFEIPPIEIDEIISRLGGDEIFERLEKSMREGTYFPKLESFVDVFSRYHLNKPIFRDYIVKHYWTSFELQSFYTHLDDFKEFGLAPARETYARFAEALANMPLASLASRAEWENRRLADSYFSKPIALENYDSLAKLLARMKKRSRVNLLRDLLEDIQNADFDQMRPAVEKLLGQVSIPFPYRGLFKDAISIRDGYKRQAFLYDKMSPDLESNCALYLHGLKRMFR